MKIKLVIFLCLGFIGLQGGQAEFNSLGVLYPAEGNPLISVRMWCEAKYKIKEIIDSRFVSADKWLNGNNVYIISQELEDKVKVKKFVFDDETLFYGYDKTWTQIDLPINELSQLPLFDCSYLVCIPYELSFSFLRECSQLINSACNQNIPTAIHYSHCISETDLKEILSALLKNKHYAIINSKKIEQIMDGKKIEVIKKIDPAFGDIEFIPLNLSDYFFPVILIVGGVIGLLWSIIGSIRQYYKF